MIFKAKIHCEYFDHFNETLYEEDNNIILFAEDYVEAIKYLDGCFGKEMCNVYLESISPDNHFYIEDEEEFEGVTDNIAENAMW